MDNEEILLFIGSAEIQVIAAMRMIDANSHGILFITENNKLVGCVTDGDIRRWLIKTGDLNALVRNFMIKEPKYVYQVNVNDAIRICNEYEINIVPILNSQDEIVDIYIHKKHSIKKRNNELHNIPLVIMAGGKGTRLYPYTQILPKPLIPIGEKTITEWIIERFRNYGCDKVDMIVNYKKHFIESYFQDSEVPYNVGFIEEKEFMGTGGGLKLLEGRYVDTFFLSNCDILIDEDYSDIYRLHKEQNNIITMVCAIKNVTIPYGVVKMSKDGTPIGLVEKPEMSFMTNTGLYVIDSRFLDYIPRNTFIHITEIIQKCIESDENVGIYPISEENWMDMGQLEELDRMKRKLSID
ncbi:MAG: CBS domain-containing protein [Lachnospiraceae bacterium]|nr:CBS domain-containing protein [Lachnospiraceae bacterium]